MLLHDKDDKIPKVNTLVPIITCWCIVHMVAKHHLHFLVFSLTQKDIQNKWQRWQDTKGIIRSRKLRKDRKYNDQQNTTHKTIDGATRSPLKTGVNTDARKGSAVPAPLVGSSASYKIMHIVRSILTKFVYTKHLGKEGRVLKHVFCLSDQANSSWWPLVVGITEHVIYVADARTC